ncbi:response regulator [Niveibacterium sp. SC-1]|uniref:response regulator n=1 Tax=Niveibacterium sp. SC-1 TaxID=3135646 RepID=UPI00311ED948
MVAGRRTAISTPVTRRILIVDDSEPNRRLPALILKQLGWDTVEAETGEAALAAAREHEFECVLLDLLLPDLHGFQVCEALRRLPQGSRLRIIAYSALADGESMLDLTALGFDAILGKPLNRQALTKVLEPAEGAAND